MNVKMILHDVFNECAGLKVIILTKKREYAETRCAPSSVRADLAGGFHELPAGAGPENTAGQVPDPRPRHSADLPLALPW